jgi:ATP-dependent RNA helicase RhlE
MPAKRQNLLFSATFSNDIKKLASGILKNPVAVETAPQNSTAKKVTHKVYKVDKKKKTEFTIKLIKDHNWNQVLIFTRTKHGANKLTEKLVKSGISAAAIHGNKSQGARTKALRNFKDNSIKILVATDIAARGLDIPLLPHVINYELPNVPEDYVHRIGRTGRAGAAGEAISLVCSEESEYQSEIEKLLKEKLNSTIVEGFEPTDTAPPKRAASQSKGSFGKKNKSSNSGSSKRNKSKRKPHFKGNTTRGTSSNSGRTGAPKKKRY